ncbi:MAG: hypothetical protein ACD_80C00180G0003 [uncultured bacterium (gcode 4)]|uniref:Uncharacterized protein n=1 Tax=uncultured bacterium (gcode 4) TaxID=1234023 RepID=K1YH35_9BACT|nr:MAG: hypothetical protein ACD_80C00180G0003 [uncultured bacterium (gcode 4)]
MIAKLAYTLILGKPLIMYMWILTLLWFLTTAIFWMLIHKWYRIPFKIHPIVAMISLLLALIHGTLWLSVYFKF